MSTLSKTISKRRLTDALQAAINRRELAYNSVHALSIRWDLDDKNSEQHVDHLQTILSTLQLPAAAKECIISSSDTTPGWTALNKTRYLLFGCHCPICVQCGHKDSQVRITHQLGRRPEGMRRDQTLLSLGPQR